MSKENKNPFDLVDNENQQTTVAKVSEKGGKFLENLIQKIAKMCGFPDPKTGAKNKDTNTVTTQSATTLEQDVASQEGEKKQDDKKFSFDNIMSGVTGVLDKIGKTVEDKTGINLKSPLKKDDENLDKEPETKAEQAPQNIESAPTTPAEEEKKE